MSNAAILKAIQELNGRIQGFDARLTVLEKPKHKDPQQVNNTSAPESFPGDFNATTVTFPMTKDGVEAGRKLIKRYIPGMQSTNTNHTKLKDKYVNIKVVSPAGGYVVMQGNGTDEITIFTSNNLPSEITDKFNASSSNSKNGPVDSSSSSKGEGGHSASKKRNKSFKDQTSSKKFKSKSDNTIIAKPDTSASSSNSSDFYSSSSLFYSSRANASSAQKINHPKYKMQPRAKSESSKGGAGKSSALCLDGSASKSGGAKSTDSSSDGSASSLARSASSSASSSAISAGNLASSAVVSRKSSRTRQSQYG